MTELEKNILGEKQAICESVNCDRVIEFRSVDKFPIWFQEKYVEGDVWDVYYDENNVLMCEDKSGNITKI